jgi:hypothetical protein
MFYLANLASILHTLFNDTADNLAHASGFIIRQREISAYDFLRALVFGFLKRRDAPLDDLGHALGVSRQALDQRFNRPAPAAFLKAALLHAARHVFAHRPEACAFLASFNSVFLDDSTQARMPDEAADDFPGCGSGGAVGQGGKAGMKAFVRLEIQGGQIHHIGIHSAKTSDHAALAAAPSLPPGCLHLADLGFFDLERLGKESERGVIWITRLPANSCIQVLGSEPVPLHEALKSARRSGRTELDIPCVVGSQGGVPGRLVALACPPDKAAWRLAKLKRDASRRGRAVSERQQEMCRWTVLFPNRSEDVLPRASLWRVYQLRWQIELLFKRFKSEGGLGQTRSGKQYRVECEWYAKLLGQLLQSWILLLAGGPLRDVNTAQVRRVIADHLVALARVLDDTPALVQTLERIQAELESLRERTKRKKRKTVSQSIEDHELAA